MIVLSDDVPGTPKIYVKITDDYTRQSFLKFTLRQIIGP